MTTKCCYFCCDPDVKLTKCGDCPTEGCSAHLGLHSRGGGCQPWRVATVEGAGRGLIASRDIAAGEVVLRDWPVVEGPLPDGGDTVCVVCLGGEEVLPCSVCSLPVCKSRQKGCKNQHKKECDVMGEKGDIKSVTRDNLYTIVAVLRLLWEMERDPNIRSLLDPLMDHKELIQEDESKQKVVKFLSDRNHAPELVWRCLGLLQTNGVTSHSVSGVATGHGLYPVFSVTNHNCVANTRHATVDTDTFCLLAVVDIKAGEEITTSYKSSSLGSIVRRPPFKQLWNFDCRCRRCSDPTELGTQASSIKCPVSRCAGHCLPLDCLVYTSDWKCDKCGNILAADDAIDITERVQCLYKEGGAGLEDMEKTLERILEKVHSRHYIAMQVKRMLMLMYGNCKTHRLQLMFHG